MRAINNVTLRIIFALVLGVVLIAWPDSAIVYLVITIGILFLVTGLISLVGYLSRDKNLHPSARFPIDGAGSTLFGLVLVIMPSFFVSVLMYLLGILLILAGITQISALVSARKWTEVSFGFYVVPILILLSGLIVLFNPFAVAATAFMVLGIASLVYGISDLVNYMKFKKKI